MSPDRTRIAYFIGDGHQYRVVLASSTGQILKTFRETGMPAFGEQFENFSWSPNGKYLLVSWDNPRQIILSRDGTYEKHITNIISGNPVKWVGEDILTSLITDGHGTTLVIYDLSNNHEIHVSQPADTT